MNKPNNYENTQVGEFTPVELGAHYGVIKNVSEKETKNGDPMIVVSIDFDKKDAQADYFTEAFKKDVRPDKKYPNQATNYIMSEYQGACTKGFKSFIKAYADSNGLKETDIKWGNDFAKQFKNKKIGVAATEGTIRSGMYKKIIQEMPGVCRSVPGENSIRSPTAGKCILSWFLQ